MSIVEAINPTLGALGVGAILGFTIGFLLHRYWIVIRRKNLILALRGNAVDWLRSVERDHEAMIKKLAEAVEELASASGKVADAKKALIDSNLVGIIDEIDKNSVSFASAQRGAADVDSEK